MTGDTDATGGRPGGAFPTSLCRRCAFVREIVSGKGSVFLMCGKALTDDRLPKDPPQPVRACVAYEPVLDAGDSESA